MKFLVYIVLIAIGTSIFAAVLWHTYSHKTNFFSSLSPIPDSLTLTKNQQVRLLDLWLPFINNQAASSIVPPQVTARSVLIYDLTDKKNIYEKNPTKRMPLASLTKIMTAIISLDNKRSDDAYIVHNRNLVGEDSMGLSAGEVLNQKELLYGLMLPSGNDAAEVLADNSPLGREGFIRAMNDKAKALGLNDTHFNNPSGLQGDGIQYTTAYDLLVITRYALDNYPLFAKIVATSEYTIAANAAHKEYDLVNETNLLTTYEGVKGVKTGYTPEAGLCLVTYLDYKEHKIIAVMLNSEDRRGEMLLFLDYSLRTLGITPPAYKG